MCLKPTNIQVRRKALAAAAALGEAAALAAALAAAAALVEAAALAAVVYYYSSLLCTSISRALDICIFSVASSDDFVPHSTMESEFF